MEREFQSASFNSVTEPRRTEEQLRRDARRDAFRIKLTDALRALTDPVQIQVEAVRMIGERLRVNHAFYSEIETVEGKDDYVIRQDYHTQDVPSNVGRFRSDDFGEFVINELRAGNTFIVSDMATDERFIDEVRSAYTSSLHIQAWIATPLIKGGCLVGTFGVQHKTAREWTPDEIGLIEDAAERIWAVVERAKAEEALRESHMAALQNEARLRTLVEPFAQAVWETDAAGMVVTDSPSWRAYTGQTMEEWLGEGWLNAVHPDDRAWTLRQWRETIHNGTPIHAEFRLRSPDGNWRWTNIRAAALRDADGKVLKWVGMNIDVTERRETEEALRRSESKYRTLFENIEEGVVMCELVRDTNGNAIDYRYLDVNPSFEKDVHKTRSEIVGRLRSEMSPMDVDALNHYANAVSSASTVRYEYYANAVSQWYDVTVVPKSNDRFALLFDNITERKQAQEQIERSNQRLNEILSSIQDDFYVLNHDWVFVYASKLFTSKIGKKPEDIIGNNIWEMFPNHIGSELEENFRAAMEKREIRRFEIPGKYTNAWYRMTAFPSAEGITVLGTEITDRKRAEEALRENQKKLQLLNETLEQKVQEKTAELRQLASDLTRAEQRERNRISHILHDDLQQRIYSVQMHLSVVRNELQMENESGRKEISDLEEQVKEILEIARHLSIDLNPPILRGEGLVHALNWLAAQMKKQYGLPIEIDADEPFTLQDKELHILLFNCIRELLFNAVKHAEASRAVVTLRKSGKNLLIDVCDDGKGFQVDTTKRRANMETNEDESLQNEFGLSTLHHQLSLYDGSMEIDSTPGAGTHIILIIPIPDGEQKT